MIQAEKEATLTGVREQQAERVARVLQELQSATWNVQVRLNATLADLGNAAQQADGALDQFPFDDAENLPCRAMQVRDAGLGATLAAQHAVSTVHIAGYMQGIRFALGQLEGEQKETEKTEEAAE